jgi:hypothetical protein
MARRIKLSQVANENGYCSITKMFEELGYKGIMPACCSEGCEVEPDGKCEHGNPSILLAMGMI